MFNSGVRIDTPTRKLQRCLFLESFLEKYLHLNLGSTMLIQHRTKDNLRVLTFIGKTRAAKNRRSRFKSWVSIHLLKKNSLKTGKKKSIHLPPTSSHHAQSSLRAVRLKPPDVEVLCDDYVYHDQEKSEIPNYKLIPFQVCCKCGNFPITNANTNPTFEGYNNKLDSPG